MKAYLDPRNQVAGVRVLVDGSMDPFFSPPLEIWGASSTTFRYQGTGDEVWERSTYENAAEYTAAVCCDENAVGVLKCTCSSRQMTLVVLALQTVVGDRTSFQQILESFAQAYGVEPKLESLGSL